MRVRPSVAAATARPFGSAQGKLRRAGEGLFTCIAGVAKARAALLLGAMIFSCPSVFAAPAISYTVDLTHPASHLVSVTMTVGSAKAGTEIQFPAWNALYQIRDFVRNVERLSARCSGALVQLRPLDVDTWSAGPQACAPLVVRYQVFANRGGAFSSELIPGHAFLNLAQILFYLPRRRNEPSSARFILPTAWKLVTLLPGQGDEFTAPSYDAMVDSPVEAGAFELYSYHQGNALYRVVVRGNPEDYSAARLLASIEKITATETALMSDQPFSRYTFIFHFPAEQEGGGMEHSDGTAISFPAPLLASNWEGLERTIAHEFFHLWNVKRIRPQGLEPVDYVHGNDTRDLWFSEGVTSAYAELALVRAGLESRAGFYQHLASAIGKLDGRPARHFQSAELAGIDAWLERYPDYSRPDRSISYYNKGELLGDFLDLAILHASQGARSLDDVMRRLNLEFARRRRFFTDEDLENVIASFGPSPKWVHSFFADDVDGTAELDYQRFLGFAGLRLEISSSSAADWGFQAARSFDGAIRVVSVDSSSDAARSGIQAGDALVAVNGRRLVALPEELEGVKPGERVALRALRNSRVLTLKFTLGAEPGARYRVDEAPGATPGQVQLRNRWIEGGDGDAGGARSP